MPGINFAGQDCTDPGTLWQSCREHSPPLPFDSFFGKANRYDHGLGAKPGSGLLLLQKGQLDQIDTNNPALTLTFEDQLGNRQVVGNLHVARTFCVSPADPNSFDATGAAVHAVVVEDRRALMRYALNKGYNLRATSGGAATDYCSGTLNSGAAWTWTTMVQDLWNAIPELATAGWPGLPFSPDGTPEGFAFYGVNALDALDSVLTRLGCALKFDPSYTAVQNGWVTIVRLGDQAGQAALTAAVNREEYRLDWNGYPSEPARARYPARVRVLFRRFPCDGCQDAYYPLYVNAQDADPSLSAVAGSLQANLTADLYDDLYARYDPGGTLLNSSPLVPRANERAADYYRVLRAADARTHKRYVGVGVGTEFLPGALLRSCSWYDLGAGARTEVAAWPARELESWRPPAPPCEPTMFSGARVQLASGQSIPNDTATAISWPTPGGMGVTVTYDTGGYYDAAHPTRLTAPASGYYLASGTIRFAVNATGDRAAQLLSATGIDTSSGCKAPATGGGNGIIYATVNVQQVGPLVAGEYVELFAYQSSGGALSTVALQTRLSLTRLR